MDNFIVSNNEYWTCFTPRAIAHIKLPARGFKIHLSSTINMAETILRLFVNYCFKRACIWKVISSLPLLERENYGEFGYSQIGKFITIYPKDENQLNILLNDLEIVFKNYRSINIPSDYSFKESQIVYYRYGDIEKDSKEKRVKGMPKLSSIPIQDFSIKRLEKFPPHLVLFKIWHKTGKNAVYQAIDLKRKKMAFVKEGQLLGNADIYGVDAINRMTIEKESLLCLKDAEFVPQFLDDFYMGNSYFLEIEGVEGISLLEFMKKKKGRLRGNEIIGLLREITNKIGKIKAYGIIYTDISFSNIIVDVKSQFFLVDFEYCKRLKKWNPPDVIAGSPGFYCEECDASDDASIIYALASLLLFMRNFDRYLEVEKNDNIKEMFKKEMESDELFREIYLQAFSFEYKKLDEFIFALNKCEEVLCKKKI